MDKGKKMTLLKKEMCELIHVICSGSLDPSIVNEITTSINKTLEESIKKLENPLNEIQIKTLESDYKIRLEMILRDTYKSTIVESLKRVYDICFNSDIGFVYEDSRYLMTTRDMQKIKEAHLNSPMWSIVKPLYKKIFNNLYVDIDPDTDLKSNGDLEDVSYTAVNCKTVRRKNTFNSTRKKWVTYIKNMTGL